MNKEIEQRKPYWDLLDKKANENNRIDLDAYAEGVEAGIKWQREKMYSEEEVELIAHEIVNWTLDNIGNPNAQSGKKFDELLNKFNKK